MRTLFDALQWAEQKKIALGHFNIAGLEQLKAIAGTAKRLDVPVIIGVSEGEREYIGLDEVRVLCDAYNREWGTPAGFWLFVNADHTHSIEKAGEAAVAGFDEVLFDGGKLPFEENIRQTNEAIRTIKQRSSWRHRVVVEGELGYIGSSSEIRTGIPDGAAISPEDLTKPEEAVRFVNETGVDMLAPAVGNIHGMLVRQNPQDGGGDGPVYSDPPLDISRIKAIKDALREARGRSVPLVLHGGSGNTDADFSAAIDAGITIIHISTELRLAWRKGLEQALKDNPDEIAPYKIMPVAIAAMEKVVEQRLKLFSRLDR